MLPKTERLPAHACLNIWLIRCWRLKVSEATNIPIIASGGVGNLQHLADGVRIGKADAVLAASIFHFGEYTVRQAKEYMAAQGIEMRLD